MLKIFPRTNACTFGPENFSTDSRWQNEWKEGNRGDNQSHLSGSDDSAELAATQLTVTLVHLWPAGHSSLWVSGLMVFSAWRPAGKMPLVMRKLKCTWLIVDKAADMLVYAAQPWVSKCCVKYRNAVELHLYYKCHQWQNSSHDRFNRLPLVFGWFTTNYSSIYFYLYSTCGPRGQKLTSPSSPSYSLLPI